ncbi:MAG TPA: hypothetical protein VF800_08245 [Telluria sp.]|jgi:hypothetical protein
MASIKITPSGTFQLSVKNKLLPTSFWARFDTFDEAQRYGQQLDGLLAQGIVPASVLEPRKGPSTPWSLKRCITEYVGASMLPVSETKLLGTVESQMLGVASAILMSIGPMVGSAA